MKLSVISDQISDRPEEAFPLIRDLGYTYVELHNVYDRTIEELNDEEVAHLKQLLDQYGLSVSCLASTVTFVCPLYPDDRVSGFNESFHVINGNLDTHLNHLKRACDIAAMLGSPVIRMFPFRFPDNRKPPFGDTADMEKITEAMTAASDAAASKPVVLAVENCPYSHLPKGQMTLELIKRVNRPNVRLLYDPANSYRAVKANVPERCLGWDLLQETEAMIPCLAHVHIKNYRYDASVQPKPYVHTAAGDGDIDYDPIMRKLAEAGYQGAVSLEPEVDPAGTVQSMKWMKERFGSLI